MNEKFILNVFDKFEKSSAVLLHIKEGEAELTLKKEAAYQNTQAAVPYTLHTAPMQPIAGTDTNGYAKPSCKRRNSFCSRYTGARKRNGCNSRYTDCSRSGSPRR